MHQMYLATAEALAASLSPILATEAVISDDRGVPWSERQGSFSSETIVVFDFDGTISDSEKLHHASFNILLKSRGIRISPDQFERYRGNAEVDVYAQIGQDFGVTLPVDETRSERLAIFCQLAVTANLRPFSYVSNVLEHAKERAALCLVVSSQRSSIIAQFMAEWGLADKFASILSPDLFVHRKLELYTTLPNRFRRQASSFISLEDSCSALKFARSLGMCAHQVVPK